MQGRGTGEKVNCCPGWAPAGQRKSQPRGFVSCRRKFLSPIFANCKPHIPPLDLLNRRFKGQQREPGAARNVSAASYYPNYSRGMHYPVATAEQTGLALWILSEMAVTCLNGLQIQPFNVPGIPSYLCTWWLWLRSRHRGAGLWGRKYITLASSVEPAFRVWFYHHHFCSDSSKFLSFLILHVFWIQACFSSLIYSNDIPFLLQSRFYIPA